MATHTAHSEHLDTSHAHTHAANDDGHEHGGPKVYAAVLAALLLLTVITVGASYIDFGGGMTNVVIAMFIASIKGSLVALFFMHLRWDKPMSAIVFCVSLFFLALFLIGCYTDLATREPAEPLNIKTKHAPGGQFGPPAPGAAGAPAGQPAPGAAAPAGTPQAAPAKH
ncbi:MAG: cytochrome C oxidase subunit IV family protein [Bryobacteraceae bacterium]|nr:cytochrome C oxidase subunit IV family protein [Bryobacteraceae bacterium]